MYIYYYYCANSNSFFTPNASPPKKLKLAQVETRTPSASGVRHIHVSGAQGGKKCESLNGQAVFELLPSEGLRELKVRVRRHFGKAKYQRLARFVVDGDHDKENEHSSSSSSVEKPVSSADLQDGLHVKCVYQRANGNLRALLGMRP